jgi:sugar phosphate isomerase/epimerase
MDFPKLDKVRRSAAPLQLDVVDAYVAGRLSRREFIQRGAIVGLSRLVVFHGNDSKRPCGSRVDRHEHIGEGCLGLEPFRRLLKDARFAGLPMLIETEKLPARGRPDTIALDALDVKNLETLRQLREEGIAAGRRARRRLT